MQILEFIAQTLLGELIIVIVGVFFAYGIKRWWDNWRYGRYRIRLFQNGEEIVNRPVSPRKAQEILDEPADLAVFLKGVASPYAWIKCDLISKGREIGLLVIDKENRQFIFNLDKNPDPEERTSPAEKQQI
ncbi:MAG TPA: hypothetical protein EYH05_09000 [Anaerolineae bacterium]|nr:hypothetical protein [Anaerolineae bacterium]